MPKDVTPGSGKRSYPGFTSTAILQNECNYDLGTSDIYDQVIPVKEGANSAPDAKDFRGLKDEHNV